MTYLNSNNYIITKEISHTMTAMYNHKSNQGKIIYMVINNPNYKNKSKNEERKTKSRKKMRHSKLNSNDLQPLGQNAICDSQSLSYHSYLKGCGKYIKHHKTRLCILWRHYRQHSSQTGELSGNWQTQKAENYCKCEL